MIDLHTHSTESDGTYRPDELVRLAYAEGIRMLALTDHDTINGLELAAREALKNGIYFVPGIELDVSHPSHEFHLLGLGIHKPWEDFSRGLCERKSIREKRNLEMLEIIRRSGIPITYDEVKAGEIGDTIGRPHFARILVRKGVVSSVEEAFKRYLGIGKPFYRQIETPSLEASIKLIKMAGGIAVIAHPVTLRLPMRKLKEFLLKCKKAGLDGIEVFHPYHKEAFMKELERFANFNNFIITGGSDFHGMRKENQKLGFTIPHIPIPLYIAEYFKKSIIHI